MATQWNGAKLLAFILVALVALAVHVFLFEMRYMWYVQPDEFRVLRGVYIACVAVIVALWLLLPSRVFVGLIGFFALAFPHMYFAQGARPLLGRAIDIPSIGFALLSVALLVGATELRRRAKGT